MSFAKRERIAKELIRRFDEVNRFTAATLDDSDDVDRFLKVVAHYLNYVKMNELTTQSVNSLINLRERKDLDDRLISQGDTLIEHLDAYRKSVLRIAARGNIVIPKYKFKEGPLSDLGIASLRLYLLEDFLHLPSNQQFIGDIPKKFGDLNSIAAALQRLGIKSRALDTLRKKLGAEGDEYSRQLKRQMVFDDFLRIKDYQDLELIWKIVYQEDKDHEGPTFYFQYSDILGQTGKFNDRQVAVAQKLVGEVAGQLLRFHNHLIDDVEKVPKAEVAFQWFIQHLLPTTVSLIFIAVVCVLLKWLFNIDVSLKDIPSIAK